MAIEKHVFGALAKLTLITRYTSGESLRSLARAYGCSRQTIRDRLAGWGIRLRESPRHCTPPRELRDGKLYCPQCEQWLLTDCFFRDRGRTHGFYCWCKGCYKIAWDSDYYPRKIKQQYGIDYFAMVEQQDGQCAICFSSPQPPYRLVVDHDHATGKVRGLLCKQCNTVLGLCRDDPTVLARAIAYLTDGHAVPVLTERTHDED